MLCSLALGQQNVKLYLQRATSVARLAQSATTATTATEHRHELGLPPPSPPRGLLLHLSPFPLRERRVEDETPGTEEEVADEDGNNDDDGCCGLRGPGILGGNGGRGPDVHTML